MRTTICFYMVGKSSASTERFIYLGIAVAPNNFRNSERRVPLHAPFDLAAVAAGLASCHRCVAALRASSRVCHAISRTSAT